MSVLDVLDPEEENLATPGQTGKYRQSYFIRRSLATLREFGDALRSISEETANDPDLALTFRGLPAETSDAWNAAIQFFKTNKAFLQDIRNDVGGHFGHKAALNALSMLQPETLGNISAADSVNGQKQIRDSTLAGEIAATALLKHVPNANSTGYRAFWRDFLMPGYNHAKDCVYILVWEYLWERFRS